MKNSLMKKTSKNTISINETLMSKSNNTQNLLNSENSIINDKKITIKDLCPEEKARIGELLKKLAQEKEENENLKIKLENDKKDYETKLESIIKDNTSTVNNF
jgi:hypothetical protein